MAETTLAAPFGDISLRRGATPVESPLRAWSAADELVLADFADEAQDHGRLLIVNDAWGALSVGLARWKPVVWGDSALARAAIGDNLVANGLEPLGDRAIPGDVSPPGSFDTVVLMVPKSVELADYQAATIARVAKPRARVIAAAMTRHLPRAVIDTLERHLGPVVPRPARRKARLLDLGLEAEPHQPDPPAGFVTEEGIVVCEGPGVFCRGHLDIGSALLLDVLAGSGELTELASTSGRAVDLGCGNGVIATTLARRVRAQHNDAPSWDLIDSSDLAIAAARATWAANDLAPTGARFLAADGFANIPEDHYDLVVTNPPFHQGHAEDRHLTDRLLADTARVLAPGASAVIVAQRHRELHRRLRRWFASVATVSKHRSHVVLRAEP